ncbi:MAG TPA: hypothetical protein VK348_07380, partial [Planctomycetota bacterium]|nr:hypothetical protein [Planctomycetota bacterium]
SLVAAEFQRRSRDRAGALAAYDRAIGHYEQYCTKNPDHRDSADHYVAMAMAGRARLQLEGGDLEHALAEITAAFTRKPSAAASLDGLNISAVDTAKMLLSRLQQQRADLAARLQGELDKLDPELLQLPAYERDPAGISPPRRRRGQ